LEAFEEDVNNTINLIEDQISFNKSEQVFIVKNEELYYLQEVS